MKKIIAIAAIIASTQAAAFNFDFWNNDNYVAIDKNGYPVKDNGIFAFNPYEFYNPKWYAQEFINMVDEVDSEIDNSTVKRFTGNQVGYNFPAQDVK